MGIFEEALQNADILRCDRLKNESDKALRDRKKLKNATYMGKALDGTDIVVVDGQTQPNSGFKLISNASKQVGDRVSLRPSQSGLQRADAQNIAPVVNKEEIPEVDYVLYYFPFSHIYCVAPYVQPSYSFMLERYGSLQSLKIFSEATLTGTLNGDPITVDASGTDIFFNSGEDSKTLNIEWGDTTELNYIRFQNGYKFQVGDTEIFSQTLFILSEELPSAISFNSAFEGAGTGIKVLALKPYTKNLKLKCSFTSSVEEVVPRFYSLVECTDLPPSHIEGDGNASGVFDFKLEGFINTISLTTPNINDVIYGKIKKVEGSRGRTIKHFDKFQLKTLQANFLVIYTIIFNYGLGSQIIVEGELIYESLGSIYVSHNPATYSDETYTVDGFNGSVNFGYDVSVFGFNLMISYPFEMAMKYFGLPNSPDRELSYRASINGIEVVEVVPSGETLISMFTVLDTASSNIDFSFSINDWLF